ncbi:troponin I, fast skeletal muscle-like [Clupea harengus]|uniref:Troponin I, fast skeletal muscle-like n=1 Tax=Clupea harengus TaxID=7950 RepID=A0A6P8FDH3_CLUHA|nr:troponin I, fast skeletal muscle-like [Clupea harengus]
MNSSRRYQLKSLMLQIAQDRLKQEEIDRVTERDNYMEEHCPTLCLPSDVQELQDLCKKLHQAIDKIDDERYDLESKMTKGITELEDLKFKVVEMKGMKKPALRKVRMSADQMLQALLGSKHKVTMDLRSNLKQVKKEVKEEPAVAAGDWRKNVEDKAGMGGRMKMFEGAEA